jgi:hypothetical protein
MLDMRYNPADIFQKSRKGRDLPGQESEMELEQCEWDKSTTFLSAFDTLIGDERTRRTFQGVIHGIISGESLRAAVIARFSPRNSCHFQRGA